MTMKRKAPHFTLGRGVDNMEPITIDPTDLDSLCATIKAGITTPDLLAYWVEDSELVDDCLVIAPGEWHADDGNAEIVEDHDSGREAAQAYVDGGSWGEIEETGWITVYVWRMGVDADGDIVQVGRTSHDIEVQPEEPDCIDGESHDWQSPYEIVGGLKENPGVWGHGGGVIINEVCLHCGCGRTTDTWAQNPSNGVQGLRSTSYETNKYDVETTNDA